MTVDVSPKYVIIVFMFSIFFSPVKTSTISDITGIVSFNVV